MGRSPRHDRSSCGRHDPFAPVRRVHGVPQNPAFIVPAIIRIRPRLESQAYVADVPVLMTNDDEGTGISLFAPPELGNSGRLEWDTQVKPCLSVAWLVPTVRRPGDVLTDMAA